MNYTRIYDQIINRAKARGAVDDRTERHHILPRCMGGSDDPQNLVDLTLREHYIAHILLAKMYDGTPHWSKLWSVVFLMRKNRTVNSTLYAAAKKRQARAASYRFKGKKRDRSAVEKTAAFWRGRKHRKESREKMTAWQLGRKRGPHGKKHAKRISEALKGVPKSDAHKLEMSKSAKKRCANPVACPKCGAQGYVPNIYRYHFGNCAA